MRRQNEQPDTEWAQAKARVPRDLYKRGKAALALLDKSLVQIIEEALKKAIVEAETKS